MLLIWIKKNLKIPKEWSQDVTQRRTDNVKGKTMIYKTLRRKTEG